MRAIRQASGESAASVAPATLYFGCRRPDEDFLYEADLAALQAAGALGRLRTAFSRAAPGGPKTYVQHLLAEDAADVAAAIQAGGHVYVCGDGAGMAKDVHAALAALLASQLGLSEAAALAQLGDMAKAGRYVRDIWSA